VHIDKGGYDMQADARRIKGLANQEERRRVQEEAKRIWEIQRQREREREAEQEKSSDAMKEVTSEEPQNKGLFGKWKAKTAEAKKKTDKEKTHTRKEREAHDRAGGFLQG
jgi:hypothetical protein